MQRLTAIILLAAYGLSLLPSCYAAETVITGEVVAVNGDEITLDRGSDSGIREGAEGIVFYERTVGDRNVRLDVARVRVVAVSADTSTLQVLDRTAEIKAGYRVDLQVIAATPAPGQAEGAVLPKKHGKKKWYIIAGAVIAGGVLAATLGGDKDDNGTAVVDVTFPH